MSMVFVKGYMKGASHVRGYSRRMARKAQTILGKLNRRNKQNILRHAQAVGASAKRDAMRRIVSNNERARKIINRYF